MTSPASHRYPFLDTLRGFAIAGILVANIPDITSLWQDVDAPINLEPENIVPAFHTIITGRFIPIFMFLFGMSLVFIADSAIRRGRSPKVVLGRRLTAMLLFGVVHQILYSGEVLFLYALGGLLVLPLVLLAKKQVLLMLGLIAAIAAFAAGGGVPAIPGVVLLGAAAARYGIPARLEHADRRIAILAAVSALASAAALYWQWHNPGDPRFTTAGGVAGAIMAVLYILTLALLWQPPLRRLLRGMFEPLGRAAFTCYLTATPMMLAAGHMLDLPRSTNLWLVIAVAIAILVAQYCLLRVWFLRFSYGPLEWIWRRITWWGPTPQASHVHQTESRKLVSDN
ncbi:Predicted membrane protein [Dermatophilus congolensis]|uniref:Predicted membrane protein n=1 Tax=Dermatophilus congolensis TaxID=1863 RepID=A0AA46BN43_9MICO|nr:DUF418 domain-containing protein [Dermatophilus congolensis]STD09060.1 Predicted membrane protein [Dermatophilus congolensis]